ncbi:acylphosphatase [Candidatus Villigracilis affinis]|uniref:acylphosphatase n=1 Tax=Candidatus Villigracilis affinis TaxID=3140682 RepID=UPI0031E54E71
MIIAKHIHVTGIVQGVGFRPFVYGLASRFGLCGWVINTSADVDIHIEGMEANAHSFIENYRVNCPR